ncbi:MAG: ribulose-phosphate 3-epimerase [Phycisphaerales bacterium]|nr:ribulose-phosphate 3-epimerase [Phycisphaerales bacterium]
MLKWPSRDVLVAPSILSADFARLGEDASRSLEAGGDILHVDVMDGHFVPNLTFGPALVRSLRRALPGAFLDVHLMVEDPGMFVGPFVDAGADHVSFHVEPIGLDACVALAGRVRSLGATAGVTINPPTPASAVLPAVDAFDLVLVMSVNPGFGGQAFIPEVLDKVRAIRAVMSPGQRLEMDGGIGPETAGAARAAGCDVLVAGSAIFGLAQPDRPGAIRAIRGA